MLKLPMLLPVTRATQPRQIASLIRTTGASASVGADLGNADPGEAVRVDFSGQKSRLCGANSK